MIKLKTHIPTQFEVFTAMICSSLLREVDPVPAGHQSVVSGEKNAHVGTNGQQIVLTVHLSA